NTYQYLVTRPVNVGSARIQGAEVGWNQFFDFLPAPFDGLGMSANYTYIDSSTRIPDDPSVLPIDTDGALLGDLPADGLSKNAYNGEDGGVAWKLPVYSDAFGQLDGSIFYRVSDHVQIGLEMNNLNNAEQRTIMQQGVAGSRVTSWYVNDRRYAATLRLSF